MTSARFADRRDAGRQLAARLMHLAAARPIVLALPRGGVPVAYEVAKALGAPLDVLLVRKIGVPHQPELAAGAVAEGDPPFVFANRAVAEPLALSQAWLERTAQHEIAEIARRRRAYRHGKSAPDLHGRCAIVVDDGIATGATTHVALQAARHLGAARIVLAVPVGPAATIEALRDVADEIVTVRIPEDFVAVGQFYEDFAQTSDEEAVALLEELR